jgi:K+-transporting ATPase KdpF subunit
MANDRRTAGAADHRFLCSLLGLRLGLRANLKEPNVMDIEYLAGGALSLIVALYLIYALVRPERF